jgi:uncharacterized protein (TIGR00251 family)
VTCWRAGADGVTVMVAVHPKSRRPGLQGTRESSDGPRLKIAVAQAAEDGKANRAVCALLAKALHRPQSSVRIVSGAANREKLLAVTGDVAALIELLSSL